MDFFRKNEETVFHQGDVIRFKHKEECEYRYAIIAELPDGVVDDIDGTTQKYAAIILNDYDRLFQRGDLYRMGTTINELMKIGFDGWDIVEKASTRTEDLTD